MPKLRITQVRSGIGQSKQHNGTLRALGLGKIGRSAEHKESPELAGLLALDDFAFYGCSAQNLSPPSRAASASALTRPWYR